MECPKSAEGVKKGQGRPAQSHRAGEGQHFTVDSGVCTPEVPSPFGPLRSGVHALLLLTSWVIMPLCSDLSFD